MTARRRPEATERRPPSRLRRRGFTLVEALVVVTILAVLAAVLVPRLTGIRRSEGKLTADQMEDFLRMWAYRNTIGTQQVGIWMNPDFGYISLAVRDIDPANPQEPPRWREDRLSMPFRLSAEVSITDVLVDGEAQDPRGWFVQSNPDGTRPRVEIAMDGPMGPTRFILEPYSGTPQRIDDRNRISPRVPFDLDAEGQERTAW
jgi:prepilin-type N-terminal cleavage/methylation domain-containing protein